MSPFSTSSQNQSSDKAACLSCGLWALLGERRICDQCLSDELGEDDPCFSFLDKAFSNLLVAGYTIPEACTRIHQAMVSLAQQHGFSIPVWPHDFPKAEFSSSAINFGDDVSTAPTSLAVPVGNTGTTSTGRVL